MWNFQGSFSFQTEQVHCVAEWVLDVDLGFEQQLDNS